MAMGVFESSTLEASEAICPMMVRSPVLMTMAVAVPTGGADILFQESAARRDHGFIRFFLWWLTWPIST